MLDFLAADRAFLAEKDAEIQALEAQVAALKSSISLLRAARITVQQRLCSYKYPVLTLPNEIIVEIFLHFLSPGYPDAPPFMGARSPMRLTHICRQWRDTACETPGLWRAIDLYPTRVDDRLESTLSLTALWVSRSRHCPLSIRAGSYNDLLSVLAPLIPHRDRWEHLDLTLKSTQPLSSIQGSLPLLKSFTIHFNSSISDDDSVVNLHDLPLLSTVALDDFKIPHVSLPWSQLTSLTLSWIYPEHCMSILRKTTHLERCTLRLWIQDEDEPQNDFVDLLLPRLDTLEIDADDGVHVDLIQYLVAPALHSLCLPESFLGSNPIDSLKSCISRSGCHLGELQVAKAYVSENAYRNAFPSIPDVEVEKSSDSNSD
ncbi:F-box domain-containing protein [Favolaschia claudopus]|uniref:F-box domain-containing protein n=1 Tax=Favolaschia claudopus TaxID=2862362 RepID=A0AAW0D9D5_9AGAR